MEWVTQNWISLLILAVVLVFLSRRGRMGCGIGGKTTRDTPSASEAAKWAADASPVDPVSGEALSRATALTSVYRGRIYYFSSREHRDKFEAQPDKFAATQAGDPAQSHRDGSHGCC